MQHYFNLLKIKSFEIKTKRKIRKIKYKDISVDQTKDSNSNTQTFSSQSINQVEIPKIKLRINESIGRSQNKYKLSNYRTLGKHLIYCSTINNIEAKIVDSFVTPEKMDFARHQKSISECKSKIDPYKNLPKIYSRNNNMIPSFSKRSSNKKVKVKTTINNSQKNCDGIPVEVKKALSNSVEVNESLTYDNQTKIERKNTEEINKQMYSVVDLLKIPIMVNDYINSKVIKPHKKNNFQIKSSYKLIPKNRLLQQKNAKHCQQKSIIDNSKDNKSLSSSLALNGANPLEQVDN